MILNDIVKHKWRRKKVIPYTPLCLRPSRSATLDPLPILTKLKACCRFPPSRDTLASLRHGYEYLKDLDWTVSSSRCVTGICRITECLLHAYSCQFEDSEVLRGTERLLEDTHNLLLDRYTGDLKLTNLLVVLLAHLVFNLRGLPTDKYDMFVAVTGLTNESRQLVLTLLKITKVVLVSEIVQFQLRLLHAYCSRFDQAHLKEAAKLVGACLVIYGEVDTLETYQNLAW